MIACSSTGPPSKRTGCPETNGRQGGSRSSTSSSEGRLSTSPSDPSSPCSSTRTTVRSKFGSTRGGAASRSLPFRTNEPTQTSCPLACRPTHRLGHHHLWTHTHTTKCMIMLDGHCGHRRGVGLHGAELLRLIAHHPDLELVYASETTQAGEPVSSLYPNLTVAYPGAVFQPYDPDEVAGLDLVFLGLPHEPRWRSPPRCICEWAAWSTSSAAFRPQGRRAVPDVVRLRARPARAQPTRSTGS